VHVAWWKVVLGVVMVVNGLAFVAQGYFFGDVTGALRVHGDLPPDADPSLVHLKVGAWAVAGIAWVVAGFGLATGRRDWLPAAFLGFLLVDGLYVVQFWLWGSSHPGVWVGFGVFGVLALAYAFACRQAWRSTAVLA
jgi:hypothetical protein